MKKLTHRKKKFLCGIFVSAIFDICAIALIVFTCLTKLDDPLGERIMYFAFSAAVLVVMTALPWIDGAKTRRFRRAAADVNYQCCYISAQREIRLFHADPNAVYAFAVHSSAAFADARAEAGTDEHELRRREKAVQKRQQKAAKHFGKSMRLFDFTTQDLDWLAGKSIFVDASVYESTATSKYWDLAHDKNNLFVLPRETNVKNELPQ